jgi:glycosyltransferase involved in cell wall biosynthesis
MAADGLSTATAPSRPIGAESAYAAGVSVIVCTYNRRTELEGLVGTIQPQLASVAYPLEILIVDNNSSDGTADYARALAEQHAAFRYLFEPKQGLSHARNAGAGAARHGFLMYLDDDALLPPHYLPTLGPRLAQNDPDFFGGPLYPLYLDPKPDWFPESLEIRKKAASSGFHNSIVLTGANYGVKKAVLERVGGFNPRFGMTGGKVGMLEERLVIETYRRLVPPERQKIYYGLDHFILNQTPKRRMTVSFQLKRMFIGNRQFIRYCFEQGVRSPQLLFDSVWRAFWGELFSQLYHAPGVWRARKAEPERPMLALVKLTVRTADLLGALDFFATDFGRVRRRRQAEGAEDRPLRATLFTLLKEEQIKADPPDLKGLREAFEGRGVLSVVSVVGKSDDDIRELASGLNLRAEDVLVTDMPKAVRALAPLRSSRPHLQIVLWIRDPKPLNWLKSARHFWERREGMWDRLRRERVLFRPADQVIVCVPWLERGLARRLLPMRRRVLAPTLGKAKTPKEERAMAAAREQALKAWGEVIDQARIWAPRRLTP